MAEIRVGSIIKLKQLPGFETDTKGSYVVTSVNPLACSLIQVNTEFNRFITSSGTLEGGDVESISGSVPWQTVAEWMGRKHNAIGRMELTEEIKRQHCFGTVRL